MNIDNSRNKSIDLISQETQYEMADSVSDPVGRNRLRRLATFGGRLGLAGIILIWLLSSGRIDPTRILAASTSWKLAALCLVVPISMLLPAMRWWLLLRIQQLDVSAWAAIRLSWLGHFATLFLPGAAGGDVARAYLITNKRSWGRVGALSTVLADRFMGLYALVLLGTVSGVWVAYRHPNSVAERGIATVAMTLFSAMTLFVLVAASRCTRNIVIQNLPSRWQQPVRDVATTYSLQKAGVVGCFVISIVSHAIALASLALAFSALENPIPIGKVFAAGPLVGIANSLPFTPGGAGVGEAASEELFRSLQASGGAEAMLLTRLTITLWSILAVFAIRPKVSSSRDSPAH